MPRAWSSIRRWVRVVLDGSGRTLPVAAILMIAAAVLVLQIRPATTVTAKVMVAAPRYTKDIEAALVSVEAVEIARRVYRGLTEPAALRRAAFAADLSPSAYAPHVVGAALRCRTFVTTTLATDKDKVSVIAISVSAPQPAIALNLSSSLLETAATLDLGMRLSLLAELDRQLGDQLDRARAELGVLGPHEMMSEGGSALDSLSRGLTARRNDLSRELGSLLRNDPRALSLRSEIAAINDQLRLLDLVAAGVEAPSLAAELGAAREMVALWQDQEETRRRGVELREAKRIQLEDQISGLADKRAVIRTGLDLERSDGNQRVSILAAPSITSPQLPEPAILALVSAAVIGAAAWLGGGLLLEAARPKLRDPIDLVRSLNVAALSVIPAIDVVPDRRIRPGPDRSPVAGLIFAAAERP